MTTVAIIQARMGSTRLPGKVLRELGGLTVLGHVVTRVAACPRVDRVVVAVPDLDRDEPVALEAERLGAGVCRGSEWDVLERYYRAAVAFKAQRIVRVTSDCPLFDPRVLTDLLTDWDRAAAAGHPYDYLSNTLTRSYPRGLDAEVFSFAALEQAHREARDPGEREHVTPYLYRHPALFRLGEMVSPVDLSGHRWTLDTPEDWRLLEAIFTELGGDAPFTTDQVLELLARRPDLVELNAHIEQKKV